MECGFTVDSHVAVLRPCGISPVLLAYLLCSPMGQIQFQRAESGASGQTAVSEEDVRRFRFPRVPEAAFEQARESFTAALEEARRLEAEAYKKRQDGWGPLRQSCCRPMASSRFGSRRGLVRTRSAKGKLSPDRKPQTRAASSQSGRYVPAQKRQGLAGAPL